MNNLGRHLFFALVAAIFLAGNFSTGVASTPEAAQLEFFESKIRPLLVENCYKCHSTESEKLKGGLRLDSKEAVLKGGDSGPALVPENPEASLLIKAVRYTDENLQMPPKGKKLAPEQIADLETWIKLGALDPRTESAQVKVQTTKSPKDHWAFQPIKNAPVPKVKYKSWPKTPIDNFILAKLEEKNLKPAAPADKYTLIRRTTFDLTGLPPTHSEVENFLKDKSPDAFAKVVDRLLASLRYGERWGRHWLDVARYADTKGYLAGNQERRFPYSYTYRDYVIRAFNDDLPYDKFILQQIAADRLELGEDKKPLAALGFLTLGRVFLGNIHDITDDRIDVVTRGTMALTVACARCHDHKYDPISTKDYYSLYGVFASSHEPAEKPLLGLSVPEKKLQEYLAEKGKRDKAVKDFRETKSAEILSTVRQKTGDYLLAAFDTQQLKEKKQSEALARERSLDPGIVQQWAAKFAAWSTATNPIFAPWFQFSQIAPTNFTAETTNVISQIATQTFLNPLVANLFTNAPSSMKEVSERYGKLFSDIEKNWETTVQTSATNGATVTALAEANQESLRQILFASDSPTIPSNIERLFDVASIEKLRSLRQQVGEVEAVHPGSPPRAMSLVDNANPVDWHVFIRGNPNNQGVLAPRQFLPILAGENPKPFQNGSGRLELAEAIVNKTNPLTARVIVNRVWLNHFGKGLVSTPSDFGVRSDPPSHPELLDFLAWNFMENGWSLKKLHRQILLSSVYQQSSTEDLRAAKIDPENRLLWKMNRQRLDFESVHDSFLAVADKLELVDGGQPVDIVSEPFAKRRAVFGYIDRQNLPGIFRTFDFANPDTSSAQRFFTTVPQQALFLLNSPFVIEQAKNLTSQSAFENLPDDKTRIEFLYEKIYQRAPVKAELKLSEDFLRQQSALPALPTKEFVWQYGFGGFNESKKAVQYFALKQFVNGQWQPAKKFPNPKFGYLTVNSTGGHPGNIPDYAAIRRWTSPFDGVVKIEGALVHPSDKGDGVLGRIVSSKLGELGQWIAQNKTVETATTCKVKRGDKIDFIAEMRAGPDYDSFQWSPKISVIEVNYGTVPPKKATWDAQADYVGPEKNSQPLNEWEKYAQVLLLSNEFMFVD